MPVLEQIPNTDREKANAREIDGPYKALAVEVRRLLGYNSGDGRKYWTSRNAAMKSGINHSTIASLVRGGRAARETLRAFAQSFGGDDQFLLKLAGYDTDTNDPLARIGTDISTGRLENFPLAPSSATAGVGFPIQDGWEGERLGDVLDTDLRTIRVEGDCMRPYFAPGDILFVKPTSAAESGNKVVAVLEDDTVTCKVFRQTDGSQWLEASNGTYQRIDTGFRIVGVVVMVLKQV